MALLTGLLLLVVCLADLGLSHAIDANSQETDGDGNPLRIENALVVTNVNARLAIPCVYDSDNLLDSHDMQWKTDDGKVINGESSSSVFSVSVLEYRTGHKKKNLHFTKIQPRDAGGYICEARDFNGKVHQRKVTVKVLDAIDWADSATVVGGLVGEPLTIDCGAKSNPKPTIQITDQNGEPLDSDLFTIASTEITIPALTKEYDGKVINCVALQLLDDIDTTSTQVREVTIDVWYKPEFAAEKIDRFAIIGRKAQLPCHVVASNPRPSRTQFFKNGRGLGVTHRMVHTKNVLDLSHTLEINEVHAEDFGEYTCEVSNGKASSTLIINLKEASAPSEVKATLQSASRHSINWLIEYNQDSSELPVTQISIDYVRANLLPNKNDDDEDDDDSNEQSDDADDEETEQIWKTLSTRVTREKNANNLYEITGLRLNTQYVFRIRAISEAGEGEIVELSARTESEEDPDASSGHLATASIVLIAALFALVQ